eukprot:Skav211938  [mRNA]  locus=scaffold1086:608558:614347:+ [translate_table: standard]
MKPCLRLLEPFLALSAFAEEILVDVLPEHRELLFFQSAEEVSVVRLVGFHLGGRLDQIATDGEPKPLPGRLMGRAPALRKQGPKRSKHHRFELVKVDILVAVVHVDGEQVTLLGFETLSTNTAKTSNNSCIQPSASSPMIPILKAHIPLKEWFSSSSCSAAVVIVFQSP